MGPRQTFSSEHQRRMRRQHTADDGYGRHRHLYLHDTMRRLADDVATAAGRRPTVFDYGCGKGRFIEEMAHLRIFAGVSGYDPGFTGYADPPAERFDIVTCLDVLDAAEERFRDAIIADVARLAVHLAIFDCLTRPLPKSGFPPRPPFYWAQLVQRRMRMVKTEMYFLGLDGFERAVIIARPLPQDGQ